MTLPKHGDAQRIAVILWPIPTHERMRPWPNVRSMKKTTKGPARGMRLSRRARHKQQRDEKNGEYIFSGIVVV